MFIVTLIVGPIVLVWAGLYTTRGAQFIVRHLPHRLGGVTLDIVGLSGTVADGLHVERVEIDHELVHLKFTDVSGARGPGTAVAAERARHLRHRAARRDPGEAPRASRDALAAGVSAALAAHQRG